MHKIAIVVGCCYVENGIIYDIPIDIFGSDDVT